MGHAESDILAEYDEAGPSDERRDSSRGPRAILAIRAEKLVKSLETRIFFAFQFSFRTFLHDENELSLLTVSK
jgi:hypothetical protein